MIITREYRCPRSLYFCVIAASYGELTSTNQMIKTVKWDGFSWTLLRVGPFTGAFLTDKGDPLCSSNELVLGESCYKKHMICTSIIPFMVLIPYLSLSSQSFSWIFFHFFYNPLPTPDPQSWWLCDSVSFSIICATVKQSSCIHWSGVLSLGTSSRI